MCGCAAPAAETSQKQPSDTWMQTYYQHPSPERFEAEIRNLQRAGVLANEKSFYPTAAFFGRLFAANNDKLQGWMSVIDSFPEGDRNVFIVALRWANTPATEELLKKYASGEGPFAKYCDRIRAKTPPDFKALTSPAPPELDGCWGSFFATGDKDYVLSVIRCAAAPEPQANADRMSRMAARWSLKSLCRTHPAIARIEDEFYKAASEQQKKSLDESFPPDKKEQGQSKTHQATEPPAVRKLLEQGLAYQNQGKTVEAEAAYKQALSAAEQAVGTDPVAITEPLVALGKFYLVQNRHAEAEALLKRALEIDKKQLGARHMNVAFDLQAIVTVYILQGKSDDNIEACAREAVEIVKAHCGTDDPVYAMVGLLTLADALSQRKKYDQAEPLYKEAIAVLEKKCPPGPSPLPSVLNHYAKLLHETNRETEAKTMQAKADAIEKQAR